VLASIAHRTPPRDYGPWEQVASTLAEGLVALGHEVTLFATADSVTAGRLHAESPRGYEADGVDVPGYGTHRAVEVACRAGIPLVIAGIVQDEGYFTELVEPHLTAPDISYVGPVGPAERDALLGGALAVLHLIGFAEPFGLSVVESLATGTPVIAHPLGSMPEIIRPGRTGFLVDNVAGAVEAVGRVGSLTRRHCRDDVEERFTAARMVADYAELFGRIAAGGPSAVNRSTRNGMSTKANRTEASLAP